jgi:hypothetical protein
MATHACSTNTTVPASGTPSKANPVFGEELRVPAEWQPLQDLGRVVGRARGSNGRSCCALLAFGGIPVPRLARSTDTAPTPLVALVRKN